ncbi:hypothetical protein WN51_00937 [Melipona quadrifasciata]|uniref:Uncharacterized protein n=1 Tax=Melipona quadrifasciata TaxID=166423 RepID=A0A0M8ZXH5_9HYME|nr:hypothetical protein WN51_00937 [Melipona quadrifasciata]
MNRRNKYQKRTAAVQSKHDKKPYLHDVDSSSSWNRSCRQGNKGSICTNNCSTYMLVPHTDCIRAIKQKIQSQTEEKWKAQDRILGVLHSTPCLKLINDDSRLKTEFVHWAGKLDENYY